MAHKVIYSRRLIVKGQYNKLLTIRDVFIAGAVSGVTFVVLIVTTPMAVALFGLILMFVLTAALRIQSGVPLAGYETVVAAQAGYLPCN